MISSSMRKPGINGFYVGDGVAYLLEEPDVTLADVAEFVSVRGWRFPLYFVEQRRHWNDRPLYVLDELTAYTWGARVAVDDARAGRPLERTDAVSGCLEFAVYAMALADCVEARDPEYWYDERGDALREFLEVALGLAREAFEAGRDVPEYASKRQDDFLRKIALRPPW